MAKNNKIEFLAIVGATASGKTGVSLELAKRLNGEIISCDSMQVYQDMDIGTAKPTAEERSDIPHHLIDVARAEQTFSCAEYVSLANEAILSVVSRGKTPILCGGTGLYLDALLRGGFEETDAAPEIRKQLFAYAEEYGVIALHERLRAVDAESADAIHPNNVKRVVRALEIYESTGMTKTETDRRSLKLPPPYCATVIGLYYPNREVLYERISKRVEQMLLDGLEEETRTLEKDGVFLTNTTASQAIGYKELLPYIRGEESLDVAKENLIRATRRYAKRQMTWFRAKPYVQWLNMTCGDELRPLGAVADEVESLWNQR